MFFYVEKTPVVLSTNVGSLKFSNIAVNSSSSLTFTVNSTGEATETVTLSDNSDQFEFSPTSFNLTGGSSQVITATFKPLSSMRKNGTVTITASGGSVKTVVVSGSATEEVRIPVGSALAKSITVDLGGVAPLDPPDGSQGWFYQKLVSNTTKADWQYYTDLPSSEYFDTSGSNFSAYMVVSFPDTGSINKCVAGNGPFINVYTTASVGPIPNAASWYKSRINWFPTGTLANYVTGTNYFLYSTTDPTDIHPEIPASRRYKMKLTPLGDARQATTGSLLAGQYVNFARVSSNSTAAATLGLAFTLRDAGMYFTDLSKEAVLLRSGSV